MGVFAKLDGLKRPVPSSGNFSMDFEKIKVTYSDAGKSARLKQMGMSNNGVKELMEGRTVSNPKDRQLVSIIVASALG